jgi:hypothetical protein
MNTKAVTGHDFIIIEFTTYNITKVRLVMFNILSDN